MLDEFTRPYQIPYRIMVPEEVDALLVPVPASATHVAFSTIRLEPTWMALGQAAGAAAHLAIRDGTQPRKVDAAQLQRLLLKQDQIITYFSDIDRSDPAHQALQYFGARGFFEDYYAKSADPLDRKLAAKWLAIALPNLKLQTDKPGPLTRAELYALLGQESAAWTDPNNRNTQPHDPVRRGEFCRALYARLEGK